MSNSYTDNCLLSPLTTPIGSVSNDNDDDDGDGDDDFDDASRGL